MRFLLISSLLLLSACGFRPVYGTQYQHERAQATASLAEVSVSTGTDRLGQLLGEELRDRINPEHRPLPKRYKLHVSLSELNIPLFVASDGTYGRGNIRYIATYSLTRLVDGAQVDGGSLTVMSSYAASETNAVYASYVAQQDARKRGVMDIANELAIRIGNRLDAERLEVKEQEEGDRPVEALDPIVQIQNSQSLDDIGRAR